MIELPHLLFKLPKSLLKQMQIINGLVWLLILILYGSFLALMYHNQDVKKVEKWQSTQNQLKDHIQQFTQSLHHDAALLQHHNAVLDQFLSISMGDLTLNKSFPSTLKTWVKSSVFSLYDLDGVYMGGLKTPRWHQLSLHRKTVAMQEGWYEMQGEVYAWVQQPVYYAKDILGYIILAKPLDQATLQSWMPSGLSLQKDGDHQGYSVPLGILKPQNDANTPIHLSLHVQLSLNTLSQQQHKLELGLAAALCLSLLLWMYVFKRYIGHAIQRLESLKNNVTNMQWGEEIEQPQIIEDEVDILRVAFSDLSVRLHQKQQLLQEKTDLLETILHTSPMAIWMTDCQGQVQFINQNMQQLLGLDNTDNVQLPPLFCEQSNIALENKDGDFIHFQNKLLMLPLNGKSYSFDGVCSQIHDGAHQLVGVVGLALDITARNQAQHDVAVMKKKVTHVQRLEGLGVLASGIAHDFNNLLSVIMGNAEIAQYDLDTHHSNQNLLKIVDASKRASELCQQLLAYADEANYDWKAIDISTHIKDISELLSVSHDKKITIDLQLCDSPCIIKADVAQFEQVVMNLVINATESMEGQTGIVRIETGLETLNKEDVQYHLGSEEVTSGIYAFIRIQDEGCGMDESTLNNIFDPFFTTKFTGRGLGMSAVLGIVRSHRGTLNIQSKLGDGTTMTVYLPLASSAMVSEYPLGMSMNAFLK